MNIELRWTASRSASCFHAAEAISRRLPIVDAVLDEALAEPTKQLQQQIASDGFPEPRFWRYLVALSCQIEDNRELAQAVLRKSAGLGSATQLRISSLAGCIADVEAAVRRAVPKMVNQLAHRSRPLREQWDARGPGLLRAVARLTDDQLIVPRAEVVLVHPALGGGGGVHLLTNAVRIEAVLTNNVPELPEVVRLGWFLSQLNCDLPRFCEGVHPDRLDQLAQLAMLPAVLQAAEQVELAGLDVAGLRRAVDAWHLKQHADLAEVLNLWWETYCESKPSWSVALGALDRMLNPGAAAAS